ncbi:condensation domain-containing protein [Aetokthonos hydrillicola]
MVDELLLELRRRDVTLWLEGDRLRYRAAKDALTPDLLAQLKAHKAELIAFLRQASDSASLQIPPIQPIERNGHLPLSFAQQRLWFLHQFEPESTSNNMPVVVRFTGSLDVEALEKSIQTVVRRQEVLRTRFPAVNGQPTVVIEDNVNITLPLIDLRQLPDQERDAEALKLATQEARQPFDLINGPILRIKLFRLRDDEHLLIWNLHCIVCDGASSDVFYQDFTAIYASIVTKNPSSLAELPVQYVDFAHWQRQWLQGEVLESQLNYWKQTLVGDLPLIQLPFDHPRPTGVQTFQGDRRARMLPPDLNESLNHLSQQLGTTLFMTLLAAFETLLYRYSGQEDMLISFASAGRGQVETERLIGFFSNTLMLRTNFQGNPTFRELLNRVKNASLQAYAHQDIPFEKVVEELRPEQSQRKSSLFQIKFALNPPWSKGRGMASMQLPDLTIKSLFGYIYHGKTKYDLTLVMREQDEGLGMVFDYNADIFDGTTIVRMLDHFHILLQGIVANPDQPISELPLLKASEQQQLLVEWNKTDTAYPQYASIQEVFEAQVAATPEAIALVSGEITLTYRDLNQRANQLAHFLQQLGVTTETPVGICLERSPATVVAILGVLKAGGAYVPLDHHNSIENLTHILEDAQAPFLLTQESLAMSLSGVSPKLINLDTENLILQQSKENPPLTATANTLASILYTKINQFIGICTTHRGVVQLVKGNPQWKLATDTILLQWSSIASEVSPFELFGALLNGGTTVIAPAVVLEKQFNTLIHNYQVNTLWLPTRFFHHLVNGYLDQLESVKTLLIGSDVLSLTCAQKVLKDLPNCTLINTFSLPENIGFTCGYTLQTPVQKNVPQLLGIPLGNTQVYVLDKHQQPVPIGAVGELYVAGAGLAKGYHHRPDLTADRFVLNHFNRTPDARLYKTGHLVRYLPDGNLEHVGFTTLSNIVPETDINAHRLTVALHQHPEILEAVVVTREDEPGDKGLVAYIVAATSKSPTTSELRKFLRFMLPNCIIPSVFVQVDSLPLTPNIKIDRRALPIPDHIAPELRNPTSKKLRDSNSETIEEILVVPRDDLDLQIIKIWEKVLNISPINMQDNFFELGGHSLLAISMISQLEKIYNKQLPLSILFQSPTVEKLANTLREEGCVSSSQSLVAIQKGDSKPPLFCIYGIFLYYALAINLGEDQPVYGVYIKEEVDIVENETLEQSSNKLLTIADLATRYLQEIRRHQPEGPYFLAGESLGGLVALEMARELQLQGEKVGLLCLMDSTIPGRNRPSLKQRLDFHRRNIARHGISYLLKKVQSRLKPADEKASTIDVRAEFQNYALTTYKPQPYPGKAVLFRAMDESHFSTLEGWKELIAGGLEIHDIPGDHLGILKEPHVQILAEKLKAHINQALNCGSSELK